MAHRANTWQKQKYKQEIMKHLADRRRMYERVKTIETKLNEKLQQSGFTKENCLREMSQKSSELMAAITRLDDINGRMLDGIGCLTDLEMLIRTLLKSLGNTGTFIHAYKHCQFMLAKLLGRERALRHLHEPVKKQPCAEVDVPSEIIKKQEIFHLIQILDEAKKQYVDREKRIIRIRRVARCCLVANKITEAMVIHWKKRIREIKTLIRANKRQLKEELSKVMKAQAQKIRRPIGMYKN